MRWSHVARSRWVGLVAVLLVGAIAACGSSEDLARPSEEFCRAAYEYDQQVASLGPDAAEHIELVEPMAEHAPADIEAEADRFLEALRRVAEGDDSVKDDPEIEEASNEVHRRAIEGCDLYDQEPPGAL